MEKNIRSLLDNEEYDDAYSAAYKLFLNGDYDQAHEVYDEIYEIFCEKYGRSSEQAYLRLGSLADLEYEAGRYNDALRLYDFYLDYVRGNYELILTNYYDVLANIAQILEYFGRFDKAEELRQEILSACLENYGDKSADTVKALGGLGINYYLSGKYKEALDIFSQQYKMALGSDECEQKDIYPVLQNIGRVYSDMNAYDKAIEYLDKAYRISVDMYGEENHDSLSLLNDIAGTYSNLNRSNDAVALKKKVFDTAKKVLGEDNPNTIMSMLNLGNEYSKVGDYETAESYVRPAFEWYKDKYGYSHESALLAAEKYATICAMRRQYDKALELQEKVYNASLENLGQLHPQTMWRYIMLSYAYYENGELLPALEISEDAVNKILTHPDSDAAKACYIYAISHCMLFNMKLEKYERTFELYEKFCELMNRSEGASLYDLEMFYSVMAGSLAQVGKSDEALDIANKSMEVSVALYGEDSKEAYYLEALREKAYILYKTGHLNDALDTIEYAIKVQTEQSISHPPLYQKMQLLAKILIELGRYDEADSALAETDKNDDKAEFYYIYAKLYIAQGDKAKAAEMIRICLDASADDEPLSHRRLKYERFEKNIGA